MANRKIDKFKKATEVVTKSTKLIILIIGSIVAIGCATMYGLAELGVIGDEEQYDEEYYDEEIPLDDSTYVDDDSTYYYEVVDENQREE
jgi:hypothetical protein